MDFALCTQTDIQKCQEKKKVGLVFFCEEHMVQPRTLLQKHMFFTQMLLRYKEEMQKSQIQSCTL